MRTAKFDKQDVLRSAILVFVEKGFNKTSMQDLTKATGLHPGSIYGAFKSKRGLLLASLDQYINDKRLELECSFTGTNSPLVELKAYLNSIVEQCSSHSTGQHCLLVKASNELASQDCEIQDIIKKSLQDWQRFLEQILLSAKEEGQLDQKQDCKQLVRYLVMSIYGLRAYAQTQPDPAVLYQLVEDIYTHICGR